MSEAKCPECDLAQHRGDCFDDELDARLSKSLRAEGERLRARAHGGDSITYVERCDSCKTFRQRMIAEKARAEKAEQERDEDRRREYGYSQQTVDALAGERDRLRARAEKAAAALREIAFDWPDGKNRWADAAEIAARALAEGEGKE